jgi:hypothetical protein
MAFRIIGTLLMFVMYTGTFFDSPGLAEISVRTGDIFIVLCDELFVLACAAALLLRPIIATMAVAPKIATARKLNRFIII